MVPVQMAPAGQCRRGFLPRSDWLPRYPATSAVVLHTGPGQLWLDFPAQVWLCFDPAVGQLGTVQLYLGGLASLRPLQKSCTLDCQLYVSCRFSF